MNFGPRDALARLKQAPAAANFGWLTVDRAVRLLVTLLLGVWTARVLGPADYGRLNYALALVMMVATLPALGMDQILRRELVRNPEAAPQLLGTAFLLRALSGTICFAGLAIAIAVGAIQTVTPAVLLVLGITLLQPAVQTLDVWFHARLEARNVVLAQNAGLLIAGIARGVVLILAPQLVWIVVTLLLEMPIAAAILAVVYRRQGRRLVDWRFNPGAARMLIRQSTPLLFAGVAITIYHRIDQVMLPVLANVDQAGEYAAAVRLVELWNFVPMGLAASWAPSLVRAHSAGKVEFNATVKRQFRGYATVAWLSVATTMLTARWLIPLMFGAVYAPAGKIAVLLAPSILFVALGVARSEVWVATGQVRLSLPAAVFGAVANVLLNLWWMPRWGAVGASFATVASYGVAAVGATFCWAESRPTARQQLNALALRGVLWDRARAG